MIFSSGWIQSFCEITFRRHFYSLLRLFLTTMVSNGLTCQIIADSLLAWLALARILCRRVHCWHGHLINWSIQHSCGLCPLNFRHGNGHFFTRIFLLLLSWSRIAAIIFWRSLQLSIMVTMSAWTCKRVSIFLIVVLYQAMWNCHSRRALQKRSIGRCLDWFSPDSRLFAII